MRNTDHKNIELDLFGPLFLILIGTVLLLNTTGFISWQIWIHVSKYWPVLLIVWGFEVVFERDYYKKLSVSLIGIMVAFAVFLYGYQQVSEVEPSKAFSFEHIVEKLVEKVNEIE